MNKIEAIAHRMKTTTYLNEQQFLREETISPHVVGTCLQELRHLFYETLDDFYMIMTLAADGHRLLGDTDKAIYYTEKKQAAAAPHTQMYTEVLLQQAEIYQDAGRYVKSLTLLYEAQQQITRYGHVECEMTMYKQFARCCWAVGDFETMKHYTDQMQHIANRSEKKAFAEAVEQLVAQFTLACAS